MLCECYQILYLIPGHTLHSMQQQSNIVVVQSQQPQVVRQTIVVQKDDRPNHVLHLILTILFFPWIFVWLLLCLCYGC